MMETLTQHIKSTLASWCPSGAQLPAALGLAVLLVAQTARAATLSAALDRSTITLGERAILSLTFSGASPENIPGFPTIPNLQIDHSGQSSQIVIGGQVSSVVTHNYTVTPKQPGDYTIPALTAQVGGEQLTTQPLTLKVLQPSAPSQATVNSGSELAFFKLEVPKKEIYLGEMVVAQLNLYVRQGVQNVDGFQLSSFPSDGFNVGKLIQGNSRQAQINGVNYTIIPLGMTLNPVKTGNLTLGPATATVVLRMPSSRTRRDFLFDPFGMSGEQKQMVLATDAMPLQSLPLPAENVPAGFNGAVGNYNLAMSAGPTNLAAGDPITVRVQISGRGALDSLSLPEQPAWHDFKTFPATSKVEPNDPFGVQGTKTFEQLIVPQNSDIKELPPLSFSFFNPDQKAYRTLSQPAVRLTVRPSASAPSPTVVAASGSKQDSPPPTEDIVPNKQRLGAVAQMEPPLVQQPWFLALQGVPALAFVSALVWRKRAENLANNPRLRRQRLVDQIIRNGLGQLRQLAAAQKSDEFFAALFRLLQERLGERLDLPASAITEAVLDERLRPRGVPEAILLPLHELFQTCNLARYAPVKTSQELAAIIPKVESVLNELHRIKA